MLHVRYDWRRPLYWSALCLSLFLSSQTSVIRDKERPVYETQTLITKVKPVAEQQKVEKEYYNNFSMFLFVAK